MEISYKNIRLFLNLKKHYPEETQASRNIILNIKLTLNKICLKAQKLENTFDYSIFESKLVEELESKHFELLENVIENIFNFSKKYSNLIENIEVEITKKNVLKYGAEVSMKASKNFINEK